MMNANTAMAAEPRRSIRIDVTPDEYWALKALHRSPFHGIDKVREAVEYLAMSVSDGARRPDSWEADCLRQLWEEWPFGDEVRERSGAKPIDIEVSDSQYRWLQVLLTSLGADKERVPDVLQHVVKAVCDGMLSEHPCTRMLFGEWTLPKAITCPTCYSDVFEQSELQPFPEGDLCPRCLEDHICGACGKRLTGSESAILEVDGNPLCDGCRPRRD